MAPSEKEGSNPGGNCVEMVGNIRAKEIMGIFGSFQGGPGFDNYHKITVRYHVRVSKFWRRDVRGQIPKKTYMRRHTVYLLIFVTS